MAGAGAPLPPGRGVQDALAAPCLPAGAWVLQLRPSAKLARESGPQPGSCSASAKSEEKVVGPSHGQGECYLTAREAGGRGLLGLG